VNSTTGALTTYITSLKRFMLRHPEVLALAVIAVAWVVTVAIDLGGVPSSFHSTSGFMMPGMANMAKTKVVHSWSIRWPVASQLPLWLLMCVAMMGPAAIAGMRHTALRSYRWRRTRAMAEFFMAYLAVWVIYGFVALSGASLFSLRSSWRTIGVVLAVASIWQTTVFKRRSLRNCHRSVCLPARGWSAEIGSLKFGFRHGISCLGSCWCLMFVMIVAPGNMLLWMVPLSGTSTVERLSEKPRRTTEFSALIAGVAAICALAIAIRQSG